MYYFLGFLFFMVILIVICRIRALRFIAKHTVTGGDFRTFREINDIEDYEKEIKHAVYEVTRCRTLQDKMKCYFELRILSESIYEDYDKYEKVNPLLMDALDKKFIFTYSAFITLYPAPLEESALDRFSLVNTKKYCPEKVWNHLIESAAYTNEELDEYNDNKEIDVLVRMYTDIELYRIFMGCVMYDEVMGFFIDEEMKKPNILENELYTVKENELEKWLDEELVFMSYFAESLLSICIEFIKKENGIVRV